MRKEKKKKDCKWNKQSEERYKDEGIEVKRYNLTGLQNIIR